MLNMGGRYSREKIILKNKENRYIVLWLSDTRYSAKGAKGK